MEEGFDTDTYALRDKVSKLNSILATYRERYGNLSIDPENNIHENTTGCAPDVPWFVDRKVLSPILNDFDGMIGELLKQKDSDGSDIRQLANLVKSLVEENKSLKLRLGKVTIDREYEEEDITEETSYGSMSVSPSRSRIHDLERDNMDLGMKLKTAETELASCRWQIQELRSTMDQIGFNNKIKVPSSTKPVMTEDMSRGNVSDNQIDRLKQLLRNYESRPDGKPKQESGIEDDRQVSAKHAEQAKRETDELKQKNFECLQQITKNKQLAEDAIVERNQCLNREKQAQEEISRLQNLIEKIIEEAGTKSRQEIEVVKAEQKLKIEKLELQLQRYREENSENKTFVEALKREKLAQHDELQAVLRNLEESQGTTKCGHEEFMTRMFGAERSRDELKLKLSLIEDKFAASGREHKNEKEQLMEELAQVKERLSKHFQEVDRVTDDREKSISEVYILKKNISKLESEKNASKHHLSKQLLVLQQLLKTKEKEYETRLEAIEDENRRSMIDLRESFAIQQRMASKLKEETNTIIKNLESTIRSLRGELTSEKKDKIDILELLKTSKAKTMETESKLSAFARNVEILESRIYDAQNKRDVMQNQVLRRDNLTKGLSLVDARKSEMRDIEQFIKRANIFESDPRLQKD